MARVLRFVAFVALASSLAVAACSSAAGSTTSTSLKTAKVTTSTSAPVDDSTSTSASVNVDLWQTVTYEQDDEGLEYSGAWITSSAPSASKGAFAYAQKAGATVTLHFVGTSCAWQAKTADKYGKALVTVDDKPGVTVNLYSKNIVWRHVVWKTDSLPLGKHTVKIRCSGSGREAAKGTYVDVDAIQILGALVASHEQNDSGLKYSNVWTTSKNDSASGGSFAIAKSKDAAVTVIFTGVQLDCYAKTGPAYGQARITVDGEEAATVDLHSAEEEWKKLVWSSGPLDMGEHTVTVTRVTPESEGATETYINVDAFEIAGTLK